METFNKIKMTLNIIYNNGNNITYSKLKPTLQPKAMHKIIVSIHNLNI